MPDHGHIPVLIEEMLALVSPRAQEVASRFQDTFILPKWTWPAFRVVHFGRAPRGRGVKVGLHHDGDAGRL